ncbi:hypothetical protein F4779DRAFT_640416 [Xylariaceae sp. FL0662B]|nr:hypothetical protein F4779DRAFT_640416 [Xylariaceae sp. FL0662B]
MGGKVWSDREEKHFWRVAVAQSAKRAGVDRAKSEKSWDQLAKEMQRALGDQARRDYSGTMLFEHYFQNIESQRRSPNAVIYVHEYLRKLGQNKPQPGPSGRTPNSSDPGLLRRGRHRADSTPIVRTLTAEAPPVGHEVPRRLRARQPLKYTTATPEPSIDPALRYTPSTYMSLPLSNVRQELHNDSPSGPSSSSVSAEVLPSVETNNQHVPDESLFVEDDGPDAIYNDEDKHSYGAEYLHSGQQAHVRPQEQIYGDLDVKAPWPSSCHS